MRKAFPLLAAAMLAACAGASPKPRVPSAAAGTLSARDVALRLAVQAQAERIAAMSDEEVAAELARPADQSPPQRARPRAPRLDALEHWLALLGCHERPSVALCADCFAGAARLHEAAARLMRERAARGALRT